MTASSRKQLNIRSDRAYALARSLAEHERTTTQAIVEKALETYARTSGLSDLPRSAQDMEYDRLLDVVRRHRSRWRGGPDDRHDDLYDENGLPA